MPKLVAALLQFSVLGQDAMHGADRAEIDAFIQQRGKDLDRCLVKETRGVQMVEHDLPVPRIQGPLRRGPHPRWRSGQHATIQRGTPSPRSAVICA